MYEKNGEPWYRMDHNKQVKNGGLKHQTIESNDKQALIISEVSTSSSIMKDRSEGTESMTSTDILSTKTVNFDERQSPSEYGNQRPILKRNPILSHKSPCFPCNMAITNFFFILYTCEIRFYDVIDRTVHTFTS